jgi:hypothetical protein
LRLHYEPKLESDDCTFFRQDPNSNEKKPKIYKNLRLTGIRENNKVKGNQEGIWTESLLHSIKKKN